MKLSEHPLMKVRGVRNWPPAWLSTYSSETRAAELGLLKHVVRDERNHKRIFLIIEHGGLAYVGSVKFGDPFICSRMARVLIQCVDLSIDEIGDMDVPA